MNLENIVLIKSEVWSSFSHILISRYSLTAWYTKMEDMDHADVLYVR
jgi:hypothetical protein